MAIFVGFLFYAFDLLPQYIQKILYLGAEHNLNISYIQITYTYNNSIHLFSELDTYRYVAWVIDGLRYDNCIIDDYYVSQLIMKYFIMFLFFFVFFTK